MLIPLFSLYISRPLLNLHTKKGFVILKGQTAYAALQLCLAAKVCQVQSDLPTPTPKGFGLGVWDRLGEIGCTWNTSGSDHSVQYKHPRSPSVISEPVQGQELISPCSDPPGTGYLRDDSLSQPLSPIKEIFTSK